MTYFLLQIFEYCFEKMDKVFVGTDAPRRIK